MRRKVYEQLKKWKEEQNGESAVLINGARRVGKSYIVKEFAQEEYKSYILLDFNKIGKNIKSLFETYLDDLDTFFMYLSSFTNTPLYPRESVIIFDEVQLYPRARTAIKYLVEDGRYDYIETGSLVSIKKNVEDIMIPSEEEEILMYPMDFEEFLWAKGYGETFVADLYQHMVELRPFSSLELASLFELFKEYMVLGGMPEVVQMYVHNNHFGGTLALQRQLLADYDEDITEYAIGLDKAKIRNVYSHISVFLAKENKRFQISKVAKGARNREYVGVVDWLATAGIVNPCYCLADVELPLKGNYDPNLYKLYFKDTGLLIAALDEEAQEDLRVNRNFGTYKGAIYENMVGDMLAKQGYNLYYYKQENPALEMDFFVRDANSLIPIEVKANDNATVSLKRLIAQEKYGDIHYGIKLCYKNVGFNGEFYTFPYFLTFLLKQFLRERRHA